MNDLALLLTYSLAPRVRSELQHHLRAIYGGIVRQHLPQTWWFSTPGQEATALVDLQGDVRVVEGRTGDPDVLVGWSMEAFRTAFTTGKGPPPTGRSAPLCVEFRSSKGEVAFSQVRRRFGL